MVPSKSRAAWGAAVLFICLLGVFLVYQRMQSKSGDRREMQGERRVPVEVAAIERGPLSLLRTFSGTVDPRAQFAVAPKVAGRIQRLLVDVADTVVRGQVVVEMENAEFTQEVIEAEARLAVAEATRDEAVSRFVIARRQLD